MNKKHLIDIRTITDDGPEVTLIATESERKDLAARFDIPAVLSLELKGRFGIDDLITFDGRLIAEAERDCVVTLKRFVEKTDQPVHVLFSETKTDAEDNPELDIIPIEKGKIDVWQLAAEEFGLGLNPFPKSVNTPFEYRDPTDTEPQNPFAQLKEKFKPKA